MAPSLERDVIISGGTHARRCRVRLDADCWPPSGAPIEIGGSIGVRGGEWDALASADRLLLTLVETGETYRMILDTGSRRFIARRL